MIKVEHGEAEGDSKDAEVVMEDERVKGKSVRDDEGNITVHTEDYVADGLVVIIVEGGHYPGKLVKSVLVAAEVPESLITEANK